jgi:hypothetical protein
LSWIFQTADADTYFDEVQETATSASTGNEIDELLPTTVSIGIRLMVPVVRIHFSVPISNQLNPLVGVFNVSFKSETGHM